MGGKRLPSASCLLEHVGHELRRRQVLEAVPGFLHAAAVSLTVLLVHLWCLAKNEKIKVLIEILQALITAAI